MPHRSQVSQIPLYIGALRLHQHAPTPDDEKLLLHYTAERTWAAWRHVKSRFEVAEEAPGYLRTHLATRVYYVPNHLVRVFPNNDSLLWINQLIDFFRLNSKSSFCLSGSAMFLGQITSIADLDFCEYYSSGTQTLGEKVLAKLDGAADTSPLSVKIDGKKHIPPFAELRLLIDKARSARKKFSGTPMKIDFVAVTKSYGGIAATNLVLPVSANLSSKNVKLSFQFQEAVIHENQSAPKRQLSNPGELGDYIVWLLEESESYVSQAEMAASRGERIRFCVKALKRLMSLFLIIELPESWEMLVTTLQRPEVKHVALQARINAVKDLIDVLPSNLRKPSKDRYLPKMNGNSRISAKKLDLFFDDILLLARSYANQIRVTLTLAYKAH